MLSQERRQVFVCIRIHEAIYTSFSDAHQIGQGYGSVIESQRERCAMEVSARQHVTAIGENQRVVGGTSGFSLNNSTRVCEGVAHCTVNLRHAAQTVGILDARIVFQMRRANLAACE